MNILIFGAGGFIGSNLVSYLSKETNHHIVGADITKEKLDNLKCDNYIYYHCDVHSSTHLLEKLISNCDICIDLIAYANPSIVMDHPLETVNLNFFDNLKIAEICKKYNIWLVQFSSSEVYGKTGGNLDPFHEEKTDLIYGPIKNHRWIYACAKQLLERILYVWGEKENFQYTIIRPFNFIGPEIDYLIKDVSEGIPRVFSVFLSALLSDKPLYLVDGGEYKRSYTYIDDAIRAIYIILQQKEKTNKRIINIGNPDNEIRISDLARMMCKIYNEEIGQNKSFNIEFISSEEFYGIGYEDCDRRIPDISFIQSLGWIPEYNLEETLRKTIRYYL